MQNNTQQSWEKEFEEKFAHTFNIGVVPDDITKKNLKSFISSLLSQQAKEIEKAVDEKRSFYEGQRIIFRDSKEVSIELRAKVEVLSDFLLAIKQVINK